MSDKTIEEKFEEWIKDNAMNRLYMSDYIRAGYQIAQKELEEQIREAREVIEFMSGRLIHVYKDKPNYDFQIKAKELLEKWK